MYLLCRLHHERTVPNKNLSERILHGEGPGVAAYLSLGWGAEMTGIHHQYHIWGYVDPFRELQESLNVDIRCGGLICAGWRGRGRGCFGVFEEYDEFVFRMRH